MSKKPKRPITLTGGRHGRLREAEAAREQFKPAVKPEFRAKATKDNAATSAAIGVGRTGVASRPFLRGETEMTAGKDRHPIAPKPAAQPKPKPIQPEIEEDIDMAARPKRAKGQTKPRGWKRW